MLNSIAVEDRALRRLPIHWPVTVICALPDGRHSMHCRTLDLSVHGASILCELNFFVAAPVTAILHVPPVSVDLPPRTFEIRTRMVYTLFSARHQCFRSGLEFLGFVGCSSDGLRQAIDAHVSPI